MRPTRWWVLVGAAALAAGFGYLLAGVAYGRLPLLPRSGPVALLLVAVGLAVTAVATRNRLRRLPGTRPIAPLLVARYAALARASSLAGALTTGFYAGYAAWTLGRRATLVSARSDSTVALITVGTGLLVVLAALLLERVCRARRPPPTAG